MAKIIVKCKYTGHYVITAIDTERCPSVAGGCVICPYCSTEHVWTVDKPRRNDPYWKVLKLIVRQAS